MELDSFEVLDGENETDKEDLSGKINALESELNTLETQYKEENSQRIEALKREIMRLKELKSLEEESN